MRSIASACFALALALALALAAVSAQVTPSTPPATPTPTPAPTQSQPLASAAPAAPAPATPTGPLPPTPLPPTTPGPVDTPVAAPAPVAPTPAPAQTPAPAKPLATEEKQTSASRDAVALDAEHQRMFSSWMQQHKKTYKPDHLHTRLNIWRENLKKVNEHNAGNHSYSMGMTEFADQTESEFLESRLCFRADAAPFEAAEREFALKAKAAPASVDWRDKGAVTPVLDQGNCGSCYTYSSAGALEGAMALAGSEMVPLSEQQILDCSSRFGNAGCNGGLMTSSFSFIKKNGGLCAAKDYPYTGRVGKCQTRCTVAPGSAISGYTNVPKNQENTGLLNAVAQQPTAVAVAAGNTAWQLYRNGVMNAPRCGQQLDHAVLAVGYGTTENGVDYWIIKNSWGQSWGEKGYVRLIRGKNMCGVANMASFPNVVLQQQQQTQKQ